MTDWTKKDKRILLVKGHKCTEIRRDNDNDKGFERYIHVNQGLTEKEKGALDSLVVEIQYLKDLLIQDTLEEPVVNCITSLEQENYWLEGQVGYWRSKCEWYEARMP